jgi:hypothetical protein
MKYQMAERIIRCKQHYGNHKDTLEGYVVVDTETGRVVSELMKNKDDAKSREFRFNKTFQDAQKNMVMSEE